jgi:serine/threonine-protein kinase
LWRRATALFAQAAEIDEPGRAAWLDEVAAQDAELLHAVEALLRADRQADSEAFLAAPEASHAPGSEAAPLPRAIGRNEIRERRGRGGFGEVYRAFDPVLKRDVAVKTCLGQDEDDRARFAREAETVARLEHPNISRVYDYGVEGGVPFLVQELLAGEDLTASIDRRPQPPLAKRAAWLLEAARGLAHAHAAGIAHRDVKPGNLRLLPDGVVKVFDFGIARARDSGGGELAGTVAYMAPERLRGGGDELRGDVFAWGAVAWEILAGRRRLRSESPLAQLFEVAREAPPPLAEVCPDCPAELAAIVDRALATDPALRPADAGQLAAELAPVVARLAGSAEALPGPASASPPASVLSWSAKSVAGLAAAALLAAAVGILVTRRAEPISPTIGGAAAITGRLEIDAQPWATVERVVDERSRVVDLPQGAVTPLALALPPGAYRVRLRGAAGEVRECAARVEAKRPSRCAAEISAVDVDRFLDEVLR